MLLGYSFNAMFRHALNLFASLVSSTNPNPNASPDNFTISCVLKAFASSFSTPEFTKELHCLILRRGFDSDIFVLNALITCYCRCDEVGLARHVFDGMSRRDIVTWNAMIGGYSQRRFYDECKRLLDYARELFEGMREKDEVTYGSIISGYMGHGFVDEAVGIFRGVENPGLNIPNAVTLAGVLPSFSYFSNLRGGKEVHGYAIRRGYEQNVYVATSVIDVYAKLGRVFDLSRGRSLITWTAIISAYAARGDASLALGLYAQMLDKGIRPDLVTLTSVLTACAHSGLVDEAWNIFNSMLSKCGIQPLVEHYGCMVGVLSRAGKLSEAARFISEMPIQPSAKVWGALLHGASVYGDVEVGKFAFDHLFEMEPENTGNYVIMANLYS
uniref:Pentatricopeptide repeat-containing protein At2g37310 family n=1 Tax=Cajanus cajan TaxID=3821 RepID=A0A151QTC4_CAJCA|nr:Pentatricopeptide repeat-containing protein At2g37310 family [Cajanus cajan]